MTMDYSRFKTQIHSMLGVDLNSYKEQQMQRRINQWLTRHRLGDFSALVKLLQEDAEHKAKFSEYLTINTSHFFRDLGVFRSLETDVLPQITQQGHRPKIWSAGCSIGAEVYSIAILLKEQNKAIQTLLASDIDEGILKKAKAGQYIENQLQALPKPLLDKYFSKNGDTFTIQDSVKNLVSFQQHNLLKDRYGTGFDLILCRNVFIYFTTDTQKTLTERFVDSLVPNGYFVVGSAEQIMNPGSFGLKRVSYCIYQKQ